MKKLSVVIAEKTLKAYNDSEKAKASQWRVQIPLDYGSVRVFADLMHSTMIEESELSKYSNLIIEIPLGYNKEDYIDALNELFPYYSVKGDGSEKYNVLVKSIPREEFEDRLADFLKRENAV